MCDVGARYKKLILFFSFCYKHLNFFVNMQRGGYVNVAHQEIDLKNPKTNRRNAGFTDEERGCFTKLLDKGYIDTFRYFYPDMTGVYSWWSYMFKAREKNAGWRIDYFVVSENLKERLVDAKIHTEILGSDHCPVELEIDLV